MKEAQRPKLPKSVLKFFQATGAKGGAARAASGLMVAAPDGTRDAPERLSDGLMNIAPDSKEGTRPN